MAGVMVVVIIGLFRLTFNPGDGPDSAVRTFEAMHRLSAAAGVPRLTSSGGSTALSDAFGFDVQPGTHADSGDAAMAFKQLLIAIRDHNIARVREMSTRRSFDPRWGHAAAAAELITRADLVDVSLRYDDPVFVRSVYRAVTDEPSTLPFFVVLDDPGESSRPAARRRTLHFTATITAVRPSVRSRTTFHLDSVPAAFRAAGRQKQ
jgi:hypothetical protein